MALAVTYSTTFTIPGTGLSGSITSTTDQALIVSETAPASKSGTLTTRSSNTAGTATVSSGHGIVDGSLVDIYWYDGDEILQVLSSATVGTTTSTTIPFTGGVGTNLPIATTAVYVAAVTSVTLASFNGTDLNAYCLKLSGIGSARLYDTGDHATIQQFMFYTSNSAFSWQEDCGLDCGINATDKDLLRFSTQSSTDRALNFVLCQNN